MGVAKEVTGPAGDYLLGSPDFLSVDEVELDGGVKKGKCVWWQPEKGFGAIAMEGKEKAVFVHQSDIHAKGFRKLIVGEDVEFKLGTNSEGVLVAKEVTGPAGDYVMAIAIRRDNDDGNGRDN